MMQERLCENQDVEHVVARGVCVWNFDVWSHNR
jgi:hypothetical protein